MKSLKYQAQTLGYESGVFICDKKDTTNKLYRIESVTDDSMTLVEQITGQDEVGAEQFGVRELASGCQAAQP